MYGLKWGWIRWLRVIWWSGIVVMPFSCILFWYPSAVNWGQCKSVVNRSSFNLSKWRRRCLNGPRKEKRIPSREKTLFHIIIFRSPLLYWFCPVWNRSILSVKRPHLTLNELSWNLTPSMFFYLNLRYDVHFIFQEILFILMLSSPFYSKLVLKRRRGHFGTGLLLLEVEFYGKTWIINLQVFIWFHS